ncbi:MAG: hypothetical protein ASUL_09799 [Candidatus Aramenus sulfurataquae]|uniref:Uncharacterized protein n=1 Tax=Candidatus Aramenus sulfurataquae TaxID=1326980 RepID=W7L482_9CREN|nr:MAG: hypothetical protein ASUL_09799 [Candidatus Aramenus sulfurataquae]
MRGEIKFNEIYVATSRCFLAWPRQKGEPIYVYLSLIPISLSKGVESRRVSVKRVRKMLREEFSKFTLAYSRESYFLYLVFKDLLDKREWRKHKLDIDWRNHKYM